MSKKIFYKIIRPTIYYLIAIAINFVLRDISSIPVRIFSVLVVAVLPVILLLWNVRLVRAKVKKINEYFLFVLCALPGLLFGIQLIPNLTLMTYGYFPRKFMVLLVLSGLIGGIVFGLIGVLLKRWLADDMKSSNANIIKRLILASVIGAIFGFLLFYYTILIFSGDLSGYGALVSALYFTVLFPIFISRALCHLMDDSTFGCISVNFYVFPFIYAIIAPLVYLVYSKIRE